MRQARSGCKEGWMMVGLRRNSASANTAPVCPTHTRTKYAALLCKPCAHCHTGTVLSCCFRSPRSGQVAHHAPSNHLSFNMCCCACQLLHHHAPHARAPTLSELSKLPLSRRSSWRAAGEHAACTCLLMTTLLAQCCSTDQVERPRRAVTDSARPREERRQCGSSGSGGCSGRRCGGV